MNGTKVRPVAWTRPTGSSAVRSAIFGSLLARTCSCNWVAALMARSACSLPNRAALGLPRLSMPNKTSGVEQVVAGVEWLAFAVMISTPWNQKGTRSGSLGFTDYGSFDSGLLTSPPYVGPYRCSSHKELHNQYNTTNSCCQESIKSLILLDFLVLIAQSYPITAAKQLAMPVVATGVVVDAIAVANVEVARGA